MFVHVTRSPTLLPYSSSVGEGRWLSIGLALSTSMADLDFGSRPNFLQCVFHGLNMSSVRLSRLTEGSVV